ncbi:Putative ribonuclease H protein At1g65750 [Linum perenne]
MALLAKQGWNLLTNPDALISRIFKAKYFPRRNFLSAERGANPSVVWQSIWQAKPIIQGGIRVRVGDGKSTNIWTNPWLDEDDNRFLQTPVIEGLEALRVHDLFIPGLAQWDVGLLDELFIPRDVEAILKIPVRRMEDNDRIIWHFGKSGCYSVSSGYKWWLDHASNIRQHRQEGPWTRIWATDVPPKLKCMTWRLVRDIVPTRAVLEHRHIETPREYGICGREVETNQHLFLDCIFARDCWKEAGLEGLTLELNSRSASFKDWMTKLMNHSVMAMIEKSMALLWSLWRERNACVWRNENKPAFVVTRLAMESLADWKTAQQLRSNTQPRTNSASCAKWHPPPTDFLKCNVDWASFRDQRMSGMGASLRDSSGALIGYLMRNSQGCPTALNGEAIAMFEAMLWIRNLGLSKVIFETDCQTVANRLLGAEEDLTEFGATIEACKRLMLPDFSIAFVQRDRNEIAHVLAKHSRYFVSPTMGNTSLDWMVEALSNSCSNLDH